MSDYELLQDVNVGTRPKETKESEGAALDHTTVSKAVEHGRPDALGTKGALHLQRVAGNAAMGSLVQREAEESPVKDVVGKGGGSTLDSGFRKEMESSFGRDFGDVKVHTGSEASKAATSVQAKAFTVGNEIVFNEGNYQPSSTEGKKMIAHELTHTVQQSQGEVPGESRGNGVKVSDPGDWAEQQAEATADAVVGSGGGASAHAGHDHGGGGGVQRDAEDDVQTMRDDSIQRAADEEEQDEVSSQEMRDDSIQRAADEEEQDEVSSQEMHDPSIQRDDEEVEDQGEN